jgi:hypothetical protein
MRAEAISDFPNVPGEFSHVAEAHDGSLLAPPELGDLTIDQEGRELQVALLGSRDATVAET